MVVVQGQSADGLPSFGDEGLPHVWSSRLVPSLPTFTSRYTRVRAWCVGCRLTALGVRRILGMSAGEQMASSASSDDFNLSSSEPDSASTGSASSTDTFGLLSAS